MHYDSMLVNQSCNFEIFSVYKKYSMTCHGVDPTYNYILPIFSYILT
jgi:hypothetical protein